MAIFKTLSAGETAYALHRRLGRIRAWGDFLSDCIRNKTTFKGLTLMPCGRMHDGRREVPRYSMSDVRKFIEAVLSVQPAGERLAPVALDFDAETPWFLRRFDKHGAPVILPRTCY